MKIKQIFVVVIGFIPFLLLTAIPSSAQVEDCTTQYDEYHPLRPYPYYICGSTASPDQPYCASKPWAVENIAYLRNIQACNTGDSTYPCVRALEANQTGCGSNPRNLPCVPGNYSINLTQ